jgi:hypothetical protein
MGAEDGPEEGHFQEMRAEDGPEFFDPGEYQARMPWEFGEPALEVGRLGEAIADLQEKGDDAVRGGGGDQRVDFESLLDELTATGATGAVGGENEDVPEQRAPPDGENLAGIAALLALRNTPPIENPPLHTPAPKLRPEESQVGGERSLSQETVARVLQGKSVVEEGAQGPEEPARGQVVQQTTPAVANTEGRSAGPRENRGALPC